MAFMCRNLLIKLGELCVSPQITCISCTHSILLVFFGGGGVPLYWKKMWYFRGVLANYLFQPLHMFILYDNGVLIWKFLLIVCSRCSLIRFKGCLNVHVIHLLDSKQKIAGKQS